jgi:hypothetical protein
MTAILTLTCDRCRETIDLGWVVLKIGAGWRKTGTPTAAGAA